ncbi:penicillin acylase family protein [Lysobacter maris]|uniref:Penicillin acylase family protein n=1 Tax=Marilutibacter maris TaxID=1605891 RepID=A0A508ARH6_9GAMM|nr:penicillin acylase family protein [Lysobacter maris]KAB8191692.1 penicillin acylase family protein [Lysobacter maris]
MFRRYPLVSRFLAFVAAPLLAVGIAAWMHGRDSLPSRDQSQIETGVQAPVGLRRDSHGVVRIQASKDRDAFFALGYAHAQDRLWQMELQRRIAHGQLSEIFGRDALQQDVWMRTLGLYRAAESSWDALDGESRDSLSAYAAGVNAYLSDNPVLPLEFTLFGVEPKPWSEIDSLAWAKVFALNLAGNMKNEVANWVAAQYLTPAQLADLQLPLPSERALADRDAPPGLANLQAQVEHRLRIGGRHVGSNAWAVAGTRMQSGRAALANDTHLGLQIPSLWYVASLKGDRLDVTGMTLVGLPVVIFGRNGRIAWGGTSTMADVQDLYLEQPNPQDPHEYARGTEWKRFETHTESIEVRADFPAALRGPAAPVSIQVRRTDVGPVISDVVGAIDQPVALKWTALEPGDTSYASFLRANYATDWDSFRNAFESFVGPALNLVYIDSRNNIGAIGVGRVPVRGGDDGRMPVPAWSGEFHWSGYVPFEQWPQQFNPPDGIIVTANDGPAGPDHDYFISADWAPPHRARRIRALLEASEGKLSLDDFRSMQGDTVDTGAAELLSQMRGVSAEGAKQEQVLAHLAQWDGNMRRDSVAATIFYVWARHLREELFRGSMNGYWNRPMQRQELSMLSENVSYRQLAKALTTSSTNWCDGAGSARCAEAMRRSLAAAIRELEKLRGGDVDEWRWGDVHQTVYRHLGFSDSGSLAALFERRIVNGGAPDTVNVANAQYRESEGYEQSFGPGFRQLIQFGESTEHRYMNSTGQSGNLLSPHYDDMVEPFRDVRLFSLPETADSDGWETRLVPERR